LVRFLFGGVRADGRLEVKSLTLPPAVQIEKDKGKQVKASYLFEVTISLRGKPWQLHRRIASENSAIRLEFDELFPTNAKTQKWKPGRAGQPCLFNVFLDMSQSQNGTSLSFAADLCVHTTGYEVDGLLFFKEHFEGSYLFRDMVTLDATPPKTENDTWQIKYWFASQGAEKTQQAKVIEDEKILKFDIPIKQSTAPVITAILHVETRFWNNWLDGE
jgi:hypothetical protein